VWTSFSDAEYRRSIKMALVLGAVIGGLVGMVLMVII
jgi:hypothetical protein